MGNFEVAPTLAIACSHGFRGASHAEILKAAEEILLNRVRGSHAMSSPQIVRDYLRTKLGTLEYEMFGVIHMDSKYRVLEFREMFRGTVHQTSVYPREIVRDALAINSQAVILVHNHPSGDTTESQADIALTRRVRETLALIDVAVADHLIVGGPHVRSFAESGLM